MTEPLITLDPTRMVALASRPMPGEASFSMLDSWMSCPGRWLADRTLRPEREWLSPLVIGSLVHAAIELSLAAPADEPDWPRLCADAVRVLRVRRAERGWGDDPAPAVPMPDGRTASDADWAAQAARRLRGFRPADILGRTPTPVALEQTLHADLDGLPLTGGVDYRDMDGTILDWKTGRVPDRADAKRRHADQLRLYALMLEASGVRVPEARDVYVEHGVAAGADLSRGACADTLARFRLAWSDLRGRVGEGEYPLRPSPLCGWCPLARVCPAATVRGAKALEAASHGVAPDDARVRMLGTHVTDVGKERGMDLFDMLTQGAAAEPSKTKPRAQDARPAPDPWRSEAGRERLASWGVADTPAAKPEPSAEEPKRTLRAAEGRPYDPSLKDGRLNTAGYGWSQLAMTAARARLLADGHAEWTTPILARLLHAQWAAGRAVFGALAPDVPGIETGEPAPGPLMAWLDTTAARDVERIMRLAMDADPLLKPGECATVDDMLARIATAGQTARDALMDARRMLES